MCVLCCEVLFTCPVVFLTENHVRRSLVPVPDALLLVSALGACRTRAATAPVQAVTPRYPDPTAVPMTPGSLPPPVPCPCPSCAVCAGLALGVPGHGPGVPPRGACDAPAPRLQAPPARADNRPDFSISLELILTRKTRAAARSNNSRESIRGKSLVPARRGGRSWGAGPDAGMASLSPSGGDPCF